MSGPAVDQQGIERALAGDNAALRAFVDALSPVVQARVARALLRNPTGRKQGRDLRQDVEDLTQEVFVSLFADNARALRAWEPSRGLSLPNFVGLVAEHQVASVLRSGRRNPWTEEPTLGEDLDRTAGTVDGAEERVYSRELFEQILERLTTELTPRGLHLFRVLIVEERPMEEITAETGLRVEALYVWRSRLAKLVRRLADEIRSSPTSDSRATRRSPKREEPAGT